MGVDDQTKAKLKAMRQAATGDQAYSLGAGLPEAIRLYTAGAVDYLRVSKQVPDSNDSEPRAPLGPEDIRSLTTAISRWEAIVALPAADAAPRLAWAEYMLGRAKRIRGEKDDPEQAYRHFARVVELAKSGTPDPMHLADSAFGEMAALELEKGNYVAAIGLYAKQVTGAPPLGGTAQVSAPDANSGVDSLRSVATRILRSGSDKELDAAIADPLAQRILTIYGAAYVSLDCEEASCDEQYPLPDRSGDLRRLVAALSRIDPGKLEIPDRAAAVAYAIGDYDRAAYFLTASKSAYGDWIRAKLALHRGDLNAAARYFASAAHQFPVIPANGHARQKSGWSDAPVLVSSMNKDPADAMLPGLVQRLYAEGATVELARKQYVEALDQLLHAAPSFVGDADYIAERVLTIGELKSYVDQHFPAVSGENRLSGNLRDILARRLAREGHYAEAVQYYPDPKAQELASEYIAAEKLTPRDRPPVDRADGWFTISKLEIVNGMELRGTELDPDYSIFGGDLAPMSSGAGYDNALYHPSDLASADEKARYEASIAGPHVRFHYRAIGVDHLMRAADAAPRGSHLASAILCNGMAWLRKHSEDEPYTERIYREFLKVGRSEPYDRNLGTHCPEPAFQLVNPSPRGAGDAEGSQ
ncbi:MAG: hypothetical protein WBE92_08580 [Steroidobacteraceae bacterium]